MESPQRILVVDDDREIRTLLAEYLNANGYATHAVADGAGMRKALKNESFGLIVLDLTLPGEDGLDLCRLLRTQSNVPVIMLTARGAALDRILGLEMGADDYLPKPFEPRELLARIRSVLRRTQIPSSAAKRLRFGRWVLDLGARHLLTLDGVVVALSGAEYRLLKVFLDHPQGVLSRDQLLDLTHNREIEAFDRSIDLQVSRLRQRLGDDARSPQLIKTIRNEGYLFAASVSVEQ
ncbi:MAG: DNA-binding response regulator [Candidatus Meridianibacter frigidus]|nr:MAG: DNA-binding response regulator [Candidatus Eremiobacteraeota bacterium]